MRFNSNLQKPDFFEKELTFQVSCSYGPGRYDPLYEDKGQDYPVGCVRWIEQRNFEAVLDMMASGKLKIESLISHRFPLEKAVDAYEVLAENRTALGILLEYPKKMREELTGKTVLLVSAGSENEDRPQEPIVGFIGAGNYATRILIPAFKEAGAVLENVASSSGITGVHAGQKYGFKATTTDTPALLADFVLRSSLRNQNPYKTKHWLDTQSISL